MNETKKYRLKGHETFILREGWLSKGLYAVDADAKVFYSNQGADALGVGTNMAKSIRYWMREAGLVTEKPRDGAYLTTLGQLIYQNDPFLEQDFTLWIIHCNLVKNQERVTSWYVYFNQLETETYTREELNHQMKEQVIRLVGAESVPDRSVNDDCTALINMYCYEKEVDYDPEDKKVSPFAHLGLLRKGTREYQRTQPDLGTLDEKILYLLIHRYCIEKEAKSVSIDELMSEPNLPGRVLQVSRISLNRYLDQLSDENLVVVNRTAGLDMVYLQKEISEQQLIQSYYQEGKKLCTD